MNDLDRNISEGYQRIAAFVFDAASTTTGPRDDWRGSVHDAAADLDRIVNSPLAHPDDVDRARLAMGSLARIWLSVEEVESLYLGGRSLS